MDSPEPTSDATIEEIRGFFDQTAQSVTPLSTGEVAEALEYSPQTAHRYLEELAEQGELQTKVVDGSSRIWWTSEKQIPASQQPDEERFRAFVSLLGIVDLAAAELADQWRAVDAVPASNHANHLDSLR